MWCYKLFSRIPQRVVGLLLSSEMVKLLWMVGWQIAIWHISNQLCSIYEHVIVVVCHMQHLHTFVAYAACTRWFLPSRSFLQSLLLAHKRVAWKSIWCIVVSGLRVAFEVKQTTSSVDISSLTAINIKIINS